ncbi:MAG: ATP-binding protein, partial [Anaerolineae bacterium]
EARQEAEEARHLKEQFAANISHELRTPLNLILGFSEMMYLSPHVYGDADWSPALRSDIAQVYSASRHLSQLVDDVLDLSRLDAERMPLHRELTSLESVVGEAVATARELTRDHGIELKVELDEAIPRLFIDATRIRQVLLNLLHNAIRFTDEGEIVVRSRRREADVIVSVADSGVGIAATELQSIFEEFYQAESAAARPHKGMGLGLAIAKRFVSMHGGRIWAESALGQGSTFYISLPLDGSRPVASRLRTSLAAPLPPNPYAESIVLLGAGRDLARLFERHLGDGDQGYRVLLAESTEEAGRLVAEHHPRAVIRNLSLAGMREINAELMPRRLPPEVPFLYTAVPCTAWRAEMLGVHASLQKPVERSELLALLRGLPGVSDVLVVDDDLGFAKVMARMLESIGAELGRAMRVRTAFDGTEGLEQMRLQPPGLLFLDLRMPEPGGRAVLEAMHADARLAAVPVVVVTAGDIDEEADGLEAGFIALSQRQNWKLGDSLKAIGALLDLTKPRYGDAPAEPADGASAGVGVAA